MNERGRYTVASLLCLSFGTADLGALCLGIAPWALVRSGAPLEPGAPPRPRLSAGPRLRPPLLRSGWFRSRRCPQVRWPSASRPRIMPWTPGPGPNSMPWQRDFDARRRGSRWTVTRTGEGERSTTANSASCGPAPSPHSSGRWASRRRESPSADMGPARRWWSAPTRPRAAATAGSRSAGNEARRDRRLGLRHRRGHALLFGRLLPRSPPCPLRGHRLAAGFRLTPG